MKVYVAQIYIQAGINFPFSVEFQRKISGELSKLVIPSDSFLKSYSSDFDLMFNLSAKAEIEEVEIKGPTVFKKDKDIEFTIFLPHRGSNLLTTDDYKQALIRLVNSVVIVLESLTIDATKIKNKSTELVENIISDPSMFE